MFCVCRDVTFAAFSSLYFFASGVSPLWVTRIGILLFCFVWYMVPCLKYRLIKTVVYCWYSAGSVIFIYWKITWDFNDSGMIHIIIAVNNFLCEDVIKIYKKHMQTKVCIYHAALHIPCLWKALITVIQCLTIVPIIVTWYN